ncbi:SusC/RagA family TonB-linked outer membrane protein [Chitinophaga rhizophila]|uniref:TonB-dependent receptor n=1 Tax=Chitinophaga rhizophila TaxID=2866212 RepID=A0ABS7G5Q7_9BACT|nr:TonB-dependent receptor [Chitinophaga rhizophila]MBW8682975.1 TonB-dependent receptor [Chitinophaga rhizophila]
MNKTITLLKRILFTAIPILLSMSVSAQTFRVSGKVTDGNQQPLEGVTVVEPGTQNMTLSKADGSFVLQVRSGTSNLAFSFVGYERQQQQIRNRANVDIALQSISKAINEVIVVGYGSQRKSDVTGALTSISAKTIQERPVVNLAQAMQGKAAGLNVSTNIKPGEVPAIRIRGTRSGNTSNDPLYVVDGVPIVSALGVTSFSINDLNPNDIASVEILKDASATAIYGSRGANGVILVTTKKGSKGKMSVNLSSTVSFDSYKNLTDWIDGGQYVDRLREALINGRRYQPGAPTDLKVAPQQWYADPRLDSLNFAASGVTSNYNELLAATMKGYEWNPDGTVKMRATTPAEQALGWPDMVPIYNSANIPSFNWRDAVTRTGITQNHQVAVSTGTETSRLYMSLGYNKQTGVQRDQDFERFNLNMNGDINANKWFSLGVSVIASLAKQNYGITTNQGNTGAKDLFGRAIEQYPWALPTDTSGGYVRNPGGNLNMWNPLIDIGQALNERRTSSVLGNVYTEVKFTPWLKYRTNFGAQIRNFRSGSWTGPNITAHLGARANTASYSRDENFSWVLENLLYFDKSFGKAHSLGVTVLQSAQQSRRENTSTSVAGLVIPLSHWYDLASNTQGNPGIGTGFTANTLASFMGRVNYTLLNKYLLTASGRWDGSSVLSPGNKWAFFPSFALAWKMQEEPFVHSVSWINELKPRIGYGVTGNSSVSPYTTTGPLSRNNYVFGSVPAVGFLPQSVQNPDLSWEKTAQINAGIDFSVFNSRVSGSVEYYVQNTSDLLFTRDIPALSGYVTKVMNIGRSRNRGVEVTLNTINVQTKDFTWSTEINWSTNREEIRELINGKEDIIGSRLFIGQPWQVFYQLQNDGIWGSSPKELEEMDKFKTIGGLDFRPGTVRVVDQNGDYKIDADDYVIRGTPRPKWYGGITNSFRYKGLTLSTFIYTRIGQTYFGGYPGTFGRDEKDFWSWNNQSGKYPLQMLGSTGYTNISSAMQYASGSFAVVRNISLTYDLPGRLLGKANIKSAQFNVQVLNPFIFGGEVVKMGLNPDDETNWASESQPNSFNTNPLGGMNNNTILPRSIVLGLRVGF